MFFALTILVVLLVVVAVTVFVKRQIDRDLLESNEPKNLMDTHLRPLFEAGDEEARLLEVNEAETIETEPVDSEREKKLAKVALLRQTWNANPNRRDMVRL